jgi:hypothetical protein
VSVDVINRAVERGSPPAPEELDARLDRLAEADPLAAGQIRRAWRAAPGAPADGAGWAPGDVLAWCRQAQAEPPDVVVVLGAGTDRELAILLECLPQAKCVLLERDAARVVPLLQALPIETHVRRGRLTLALGGDEEVVESRVMRHIDLRKAPAIRIFDRPPPSAEDGAFYEAALRRVMENVHLGVFNLGTMIDRGALWQHNTLCNLPHLIAQPGVAALKGVLAGKPAIVLGAGPSLNDALGPLAEVADRFVVIATGTALRAARQAGIRPDLVVAVDGSHLTAPQFATPCEDLYLVCSSLVYPPVIPRFRGIFSVSLAANPLSRWLDGFGAPKGGLVAAGTVTTTALDLALHLGCGPILVTGFDLSFREDGTTHASHTMYHGSRLDPATLVRVPGNAGGDVPTTDQFRCYILLAEEYVAAHPEARWVNVTAGGARIRGMEVRPPAELASLAAAGPADAYERIRRIHEASDDARRAPEIGRALERVEAGLGEVAAQAREAAMICNRLILMLRRPRPGETERARALLERREAIDARLTARDDAAPFIEMSLWAAGYTTGTRRSELEARESDAMLANSRSRALYEQIAGAAAWTRDLLRSVRARLAPEAPGPGGPARGTGECMEGATAIDE